MVSPSSVVGKKDQVTFVSVHAIPVYDGHLIASETDIQDILLDQGEMNVELVNDFEIPWVLRKTVSYPKYRRTRRRKRAAEGEDGEDDDDYGSEGDEKDVAASDEEEEEEGSQPSNEDEPSEAN